MCPAFERVFVNTGVRAGKYLEQEKVLPEVSAGTPPSIDRSIDARLIDGQFYNAGCHADHTLGSLLGFPMSWSFLGVFLGHFCMFFPVVLQFFGRVFGTFNAKLSKFVWQCAKSYRCCAKINQKSSNWAKTALFCP